MNSHKIKITIEVKCLYGADIVGLDKIEREILSIIKERLGHNVYAAQESNLRNPFFVSRVSLS